MMSLSAETIKTIITLIMVGGGPLLGSAWLRRRMGKDSVLMASVKAAGRAGAAEVLAPDMSTRLDTQADGISTLATAMSELASGVAALKTDVAMVGDKVTTFGARLAQHLEWEEKERKADIAHRKRASVQRREQFAEVTTRLDALDARMATVEHAGQ